jgi:hypothetical protein
MKIQQMEVLYNQYKIEKSEINLFNILNKPQNFLIVVFLGVFALFLALILAEQFKGKGGHILRPSSWGISLAKIGRTDKFNLFSSTKGSKKCEHSRHSQEMDDFSSKKFRK